MAKDRLPDKLAVILHADVAGSTQLVQQDEHLAHERIQDSFRRFSDTIEKYRGTVLELRGDALLAEFERASDAVTATLAFQSDQSYYLSRLKDDLKPYIRVGIAMGEVVIGDSTVTGAGVVLAQRIEQLAEPGSLCITAALHEALPNRMPFDLEDIGEQALKGFDYRVRVYRVELSSGASIPTPQQENQTTSSQKPWYLKTAIAVGVVVLVIGIAYQLIPTTAMEEPASIEQMAFPLPDKPSIAVLPFDNLSDDPQQEYFADGMTEDLITDLSQLSGLFVIARNSVFFYKDKPVPVRRVAEELGVRYVLEGSVRRVGDQVRINAQLIDATTGGHLWAERYDGSLADIFALQDRVATRIVDAMSVTLTPQEVDNLGSVGTSNSAAHDAYLQGLSYFLKNTPESNAKAETYFKRAVELDPEFNRAYTALAKVYFKTINQDYGKAMGKYWRVAIYLAQKNLAKIDNANFADAHVVRARIALNKHQIDVALQEAERALEFSSNDVSALKAKAKALIYIGRYSEGRKIANLVLRLDPAVPADPLYLIGLSHLAEGNYKYAVDYIERALEHNPTTSYFAGPLAVAYGKLGMEKESKQAFNRYLDGWLVKSPLIAQVVFSFPFQHEGVLEQLADGFAIAGAREGPFARYLKLSHKTRLSGQEIKSLLFGHTIRGRDFWNGWPWTQVRTIDGKFSHSPSAITREGESWIEGDRICDSWLDDGDKITICSLVFHDLVKCWTNDNGLRRCGSIVPMEFSQTVENSYYMVTDQGPDSFKVIN
jgi:TolB-like protein/class 3 adenylate cyclase